MGFLDVESDIVTRLRSELPSTVHVLTSATMAAAPRHLTPVACVFYQGFESKSLDAYDSIQIAQRWTVAVVSRNVGDAAGSGARADAGEVADLVLAALHGWQPASATMPMMLTSDPGPEFEAGIQIVQLGFSTEITRDLA